MRIDMVEVVDGAGGLRRSAFTRYPAYIHATLWEASIALLTPFASLQPGRKPDLIFTDEHFFDIRDSRIACVHIYVRPPSLPFSHIQSFQHELLSPVEWRSGP